MNKRIEEIARIAANGSISYDAEGEWRLSEKEVKKFANLIIQKCAAIVADAVYHREPASTYVNKILELSDE